MEVNKEKIRYVLQFFFDKGLNAASAQREICNVYGEDALSKTTAKKWFSRFRSGNFDVKDIPRCGRPIKVSIDAIIEKIEKDRHISSHRIAEELDIHHSTVLDHLHKHGYVKKLDVWVPHDLSDRNLVNRISICETLLKRNQIDPFLKRLVTGDEKWITYDNNVRKRSWSKRGEPSQVVPKPGLTPNKVMLCVWWDWKGIVYYELLPHGQTINSDIYCQQLENLKQALIKKRPELMNRKGVIFHQDNARPHTSLSTKQKLMDLGWEVLLHPPYSPDIAPSDYHLFRSLQNSLNGVKLHSMEDCKNHLNQFFAHKPQKFYNNGIMILPEKWRKIVELNGHYFIQ